MVKAVVTGGAGFIGSHLVEALLTRGDEVTVIDDLSAGAMRNVASLQTHPRFHFVKGDVADQAALERVLQPGSIVFHLAAALGVERVVRDPLHTIETNVFGTASVLQAAKRFQNKVLLASTSEVYGKSTQLPFREDDDVVFGPSSRSRWSYAASKLVDEFLALAYHQQLGVPAVVFRLFNTVGPRQSAQYGMVLPRFARQAIAGERLTIHGDGRQTRCFTDVADVVRALIGLADCDAAAGQVFNIGSTRQVTILELARMVLEEVNKGPVDDLTERVVFVPYREAYGTGFEETMNRVPDISKIQASIGWQPSISLEETVRRVVESARRAGR
ncbi:MAG: SDR family NAD(P)-dependent oxidoreductase [Dehalococcoidia bacterium]|nr:SDR family NAD(P)-dependent oxidoreductase [Dehalococcoidia bacterium]